MVLAEIPAGQAPQLVVWNKIDVVGTGNELAPASSAINMVGFRAFS